MKDSLNKKEKTVYNKIRNAMIEDLKNRGLYQEPFADMVERYMNLWITCLLLEKDIHERGVQIFTEKSGWKKNDSVALLVNTNKQMLIMLEKLGLSANKVKVDGGFDI